MWILLLYTCIKTSTLQICLGQRKIESQDYKSAGGEFLPAIPTNFTVLHALHSTACKTYKLFSSEMS